jgi:hypothetical protein
MARLEIPLTPFVEELRRLKRIVTRKNAGEVVLAFADETLSLRVGGAELRLPASGRWPGEARASASWMTALAKVPPATGPVVIQVKNGRLHVAMLSVSCQWQCIESAMLELALNATLIDTFRLALQHDAPTLENSGIAGPVNDARRAAGRCIDQAMTHLAPLGVPREALEALVVRTILD